MCSVKVIVPASVSPTTLEHITSIHNTLWKVLPFQRVEWKPILWHCDTAAVSPWQKTVFVVLAEGEGAAGGGEQQNRGKGIIVGAFPVIAAAMQVANSAERRGMGRRIASPGPRRPAPWLTNERQKVSSALARPLKSSRCIISVFVPRWLTSVSLFLHILHLPSQSFFISHTPSGQYVLLPKPLITSLLYAHSPTHLKWQFMRSSLSPLKCFCIFSKAASR